MPLSKAWPTRRKRMIKKYFWLWILPVAGLVFGGMMFFKPAFDPAALVKNSELGGRRFSVPVTEVVSPQYGIKAYLLEDRSNPIISVSFVFAHAGLGAEPEGRAGISKISAAMIGEAAGGMNSQQFKEKLEDYAVSIGYSADKDDFSGQLLTIKEFAPLAFEMLRQTLFEAELDSDDLKRIKRQMLAMLERQNESPETKLSLIANREIFGNHPYGRNPLGRKDDIQKMTTQDIRDFVAANLGRDNLIVGIAGDLTPQEAGRMLDQIFGALPEQGAVDRVAEIMPDFGLETVNVNQDLAQSVSFIAAKGTRRTAEDFYPLYIANYILGGSGLNSRLNLSAREKEGLTYGIYTGLSIPDKSALIVGGFSSTPQNFARVAEIFSREWQKMGQEGVSAQELKEAQDYLIASYNLRFADITAISDMLVYMQKTGLGIDFLQKRNDYVAAVTAEQVNQAAARYFTPENLRMINLGKFN